METYGLEKLGIISPAAVYRNLTPAQLTEAALRRKEGTLSNKGALVVTTGKYTGRSPEDKFIVDTPTIHDQIAWGKVNRPIEKAKFDAIKSKMVAYLQNREIFISTAWQEQIPPATVERCVAGKPEPVYSPAADSSYGRRAGKLRRG